METKSLLYGLIGFFIGGFIVSVAATTINKPQQTNDGMTMDQMVSSLKNKTGDEFDKGFIEGMIIHHQAAIDMAKLVETNGKHTELKLLGKDIISAQSDEIDIMRAWQTDWGYNKMPQSYEMKKMGH